MKAWRRKSTHSCSKNVAASLIGAQDWLDEKLDSEPVYPNHLIGIFFSYRFMEFLTFPAVYDIAFQFRSATKAADFVEWCIKMYADIALDSLVDIACGTGHYLREFAHRRYRSCGVDLNPQVCEYTRWRAKTDHHDVTIFQADMVNFALPEPCHLGINFFDSLTYLTEMSDLRAHLDAAARAIVPGGLYIIEFGVIDHFDNHNVEEIWTENRRNASVTATYLRDSWINPITNTFEEQCSFSATCRKHAAFFQIRFRKRALYFEEFETLVRRNRYFTPVAYYDDFDPKAELVDDLDPWRVVAVLRRD